MTKRIVGMLLLLPVVVGACGSGDGDPARTGESGTGDSLAPRLPRGYAWVAFGPDTVTAEVADTPVARERGLKGRQSLADGARMLFVFDDEATRSFWMQDTYVPLDIAFLSRAQVVVDIQQMEPLSESLHHSARPAMFALEVPLGWFESRGIEVGNRSTITFGPR
jgi:uncharacterized protein